ncbi:MAG: radical SAM protein [Prevotella sp.]|nr:radical SAM protein [Prevotella sp.]
MVFIQIDEQDIDTWHTLKQAPENYKNFKNWAYLIKARILVERPEDDLNVYLADVQKNRYNNADVALTILPTRGCNFGCIYCYEQDRPMKHMDEQTERAIIGFLKSNTNMKRLSVVWYGGEPLINFPSVERLSKAFLQMGIEYSAKIVTNGYLLTSDIADKIESLCIRNIQITLDGPEAVHNQRRMLLGGQPTYRIIMDNLKYLLQVNKSVTIDIRTNVDRRNMEEYNTFYQNFKTEVDNPRVNLYPGFVSDLLSSECVSAEHNISAGGYKAQFALDIYDKYGIEIKSFLPKYRRHSCVASKYWAFVIGPEGELYKCWRMVGNKQQEIGNVNNLKIDMAKFSRYIIGVDYTLDPKCLACEFITLCGGGCPLVRMRNKYEGLTMNHCCPEKSHMEQLMEMRYDMYLKQKAAKHG